MPPFRCSLFAPPKRIFSTLSARLQQSPHHHDLPTFLAYATGKELDPTSTVYVGTHYEYTVASSLSRISMTLTRVGGRSDAGVDLLGHWHLPSTSPPYAPLPVLVQCKAFQASSNWSAIMREMEGSLASAPRGWRKEGASGGAVGIVVGPRTATRGVRTTIANSSWPLCWVMCETDGRLTQVIWNGRAERLGLLGIGVGSKYLTTSEGVKEEVVLTWKGEEIAPRSEKKDDIEGDKGAEESK
ncbi:MAG: hypothetical protein M1834_005350 [Cirrosporium novae-zelandiae]|nr:MAG: hypothetical protein M1834_005350 [Cirrosporium novae-zelandiae]